VSAKYTLIGLISQIAGKGKMLDCELLATCPFYNDRMHSDMPEVYKEQYCKRDYAWCSRYLTFKALQRNMPKEAKGRQDE